MNQVVQLIENNQKQAMLFSLGIGSGASQQLIVQSAKAGRGIHQFVSDGVDINNKVIGLLKVSMQKLLYDFQLNVDQSKVNAIVPDIREQQFIRENESIQVYVFLKEGFESTDVALKVNGVEVAKHSIA